jgi:hypothetical protein
LDCQADQRVRRTTTTTTARGSSLKEKDKILNGFCFSYLTQDGVELLHVSSFAKSKNKAKRYFNSQNNQRLQPVKMHKFYAVKVIVGDLQEKKESDE